MASESELDSDDEELAPVQSVRMKMSATATRKVPSTFNTLNISATASRLASKNITQVNFCPLSSFRSVTLCLQPESRTPLSSPVLRLRDEQTPLPSPVLSNLQEEDASALMSPPMVWRTQIFYSF
jgi:hypothetical protein